MYGNIKDLVGQKYGRLTVIKFNGSVKYCAIWECKCDCGNSVNVRAKDLRSGNTKSCGCYAKEIHTKVGKENFKKAEIIEHVNIPLLLNPKLRVTNKSGVTGVWWETTKQLWASEIWFQCKRYKLGRYDKFDDAVKARKRAEEKLHGDFLKWYFEEYKKENMMKS